MGWDLAIVPLFYDNGNVETIFAKPAPFAYRSPDPLSAAEAVACLAALAQPTRLSIYRRLVEFAPDGSTPGELVADLDLAAPTLSFHLKELVNARLVVDTREGRRIRYRAELETMNALMGYLTDHCCRGSGRLADSGACPADCAPAARPSSVTPEKDSR